MGQYQVEKILAFQLDTVSFLCWVGFGVVIAEVFFCLLLHMMTTSL